MKNITKKIVLNVEKRFGTPTYLYDTKNIAEKYKAIRKSLHDECDIHYSMKANPLLGLCQYFFVLGAHCEVSSKNELLTALKSGFHPNQIIFVGPAKTKEELNLCINKKIRAIVCESIDEVFFVDFIAAQCGHNISIMVRINPDFYVAKAPIKMSGVATQFGVDLEQFIQAYPQIAQLKHVVVEGIHVYNASRVLDCSAIINNVEKILSLARHLEKLFCIQWKLIDIGGGLGVPYFENESAINIENLIPSLNKLFSEYKKENRNVKFILELGRYLIAESGCLISKVHSVKKSHGKNYVLVDAGMHCHLAVSGLASFVHRNFTAKVFHKNKAIPSDEKKPYQVAGPLCTPGDILLRDFRSDAFSPGDCLVIFNAGAYGLSASPGKFLSHGSPAEIIFHEDQFFLARERETLSDILSCQKNLIENF
ncbi:MAG: diaminopimelate decarboxylase [Gammaproteobacteria bacterium CG_4_10_14_0_8_um_filter_38_16]|nr:MAG: diaminopimelate decarboxylase [Gammaproteobacteria bacterium CG_4_10_14_0_8_um_filter_38_16]PJA03511.1 MAG: diaminopimelate decarboxylase [Gammaproteobacteria bacterium CG_4_10_14_0_2_um_filter_38_22]PJB10766.1 MAG: diaminopimelate decarboxylase [Gammaproteobacteria bacterium CG_4_9_14_3_um_filter_38_9]